MFNDQEPPVITEEEVAEFVASLHTDTPDPLGLIQMEVGVHELAWASKDTTDGTEGES